MDAHLCSFPGCGRKVEAKGLCNAHYRQHLRGRALTALRGPNGSLSLDGSRGVRLPGLTISRACSEVLAEKGPTVYAAARDVLEAFADSEITREAEAPRPAASRERCDERLDINTRCAETAAPGSTKCWPHRRGP